MLDERWKSGAGRSIRELACRVWACVRPLYRNLEPRARNFLGVVATSVEVSLRNVYRREPIHLKHCGPGSKLLEPRKAASF